MSTREGLDGLRDELVEQLCAAGVVRDERVAWALRSVPRHLFVPGESERAYRDEAVSTKWAPDGRPISSSSQPGVMAVMLEQLEAGCGQRVLEIGTGTGYNAALLAHLVGETGQVITMDIEEDLVEQARRNLSAANVGGASVVCADGGAGWPAGAPYDRIMLTVGAWDVAPAWANQLAAGGRLVVPLSLRGVQRTRPWLQVPDYQAFESWAARSARSFSCGRNSERYRGCRCRSPSPWTHRYGASPCHWRRVLPRPSQRRTA